MDDSERTEWSTAIPLRHKASDGLHEEMPNPYTRLEAVRAIEERLAWLHGAVRDHADDPQVGALEAALAILLDDLHTAVWGALRPVEAVRAAPSLAHLAQLLWPPAPAADGDAGDQAPPVDRTGVEPTGGGPASRD